MQFQIEQVLKLRDRSVVFVRQLGSGDFALSESPKLGGVPIVRYIGVPRKLKADGTQDFGIFGFTLVSPEDAEQLVEGEVVELS